MNRITYISDFYADEVVGGGELNDDVLIKELDRLGYDIELHKSETVRILDIQQAESIVVSNFCLLPNAIIKKILNKKYIIYEHDHKYLRHRNPSIYADYLAPKLEIVNREFYKNASAVLCQSDFHANIVRKNLQLENIISLGGNLWSDESFDIFEQICKLPKNRTHAILNCKQPHKGTKKAIYYCNTNNIDYELIADVDPINFLKKLGAHGTLVFFPETPETLSRIVVEARMMGMSTKTTKNIGAIHEDWFHKKGVALIEHMKNKKKNIVKTVLENLNEQ
tara:strand:+ start:3216 stop:4055 length:840 start_codon:yes stop_codon:yes gene_type:complete